MGTISKKYSYGWYGSCDTIEDCEPMVFHDLGYEANDNRSYIESVIRVSEFDGYTFEKFTSYNPGESLLDTIATVPGKTFDDYFNTGFKQMECGAGYMVVSRDGNPPDFVLDEFNVADGTSFIAMDCAGLQPPPSVCTEAGFTDYVVGPSTLLSDQQNGVVSSAFSISGTLSISSADSNVEPQFAMPYPVDVSVDGTIIGHVTYSGQPSGFKMYFTDITSGVHQGKCLTGTIADNLCQLEE